MPRVYKSFSFIVIAFIVECGNEVLCLEGNPHIIPSYTDHVRI